MKDYSAMSDFEINKEVAYFKIGGDWLLEPTDERKFTFYNLDVETKNTVELPDYCNNPADAWQIIMENRISIIPEPQSGWTAVSGLELYSTSEYLDERFHDKIIAGDYNPLRAAMIVYLQMMEQKK